VGWDAETGKRLAGPLKHADQVSFAQFSPEGKHVATASYDNTARVRDAQTEQPVGEALRHENLVQFVEFSPDNRSRNLRLTAIRSFFHYAAYEEPAHN
jgi:WD40 repeat protein